MRQAGALGKAAPVFKDTDFRLAAVAPARVTFPQLPRYFGHGRAFRNWGMLGNDQYGDCTCAGACHEHMLLGKIDGKPAPFTAENALNLYSAITGFNPNDPSTDQGAVVSDVLAYRRKTGVTDANGTVHKIGAYVRIDPLNWEQVMEAIYCFDAVGIGFQVPQSAFQQFNDGQPWTLVQGSPIEGGHYVPLVGTPDRYSKVTCVTWGQRQVMAKPFFDYYADEVWAYVTPDQIESGGLSERGFDLAGLQSLLSQL